MFMWLVASWKALTWDHIQHRGFEGPLRCVLCEHDEETKNHMLNLCTFASTLWDIGAITFQPTNRKREISM